MKLTARQEAAKTRLGQDVCVVAGPGSGKTRVLTERVGYLMEEMGVPGKAILAITFTEKAANEIRERVERALGEKAATVQVGTLHGFCFRLLREHALRAGLDPAVELWDEDEAGRELREAVDEELNRAAREEKAALRALLRVWSPLDPAGDLCAMYRRVRGVAEELRDVPPVDRKRSRWGEFLELVAAVEAAPAKTDNARAWKERFAEWAARCRALGEELRWEHVGVLAEAPKGGNLPVGLKGPAVELYTRAVELRPDVVDVLVEPERRYLVELFRRCAENYAVRKRLAGKLDFADLEHATIAMLESDPEWRETVLQPRYEHILMDEMQDTNPVQWQVVNLLRTPGSFFGVGDVNQSIYGFRNAAPEQFGEYEASVRRRGWVVDELRENFRSRAEILAFAEEVTGEAEGMIQPRLEGARRFRVEEKPVVMREFASEAEEWNWIASEIGELVGRFVVDPKDGSPLRRARYGDIAVLARKARTLEQIAFELARVGIPYQLSGGFAFYDSQEVLDLLNWLRVLENPLDGVARAAVLRSPLFAVTDEELLRGWEPERYRTVLGRQRSWMEGRDVAWLLEDLLQATGYRATLGAGQRANVAKFVEIVRRVGRGRPTNLRRLVEEMEGYQQASREKNAELSEARDAVSLLTVHAAKGLEFPVVMIAGARGRAGSQKGALSFSAEGGLGARWRNPLTGKSEPDTAESKNAALDKDVQKKELSRTLYVAMTRAEQRLVVSWTKGRREGWRGKELLGDKSEPAWVETGEEVVGEVEESEGVAEVVVEVLRPLPEIAAETGVVTASDLGLWLQCQRRYFLDRVAGLKHWDSVAVERFDEEGEGRAEWTAAEVGSAVHRILAGVPEAEEPEEAFALAEVFLRSPLGQRAEKAEIVEREFDFVFAHEGVVVQGQIDLWFRDGEGVCAVDYKTDAVRGEGVGQRATEYAGQLGIYVEVLRRMFPGESVRGFLHFLRTDTVVEMEGGIPESLMDQFARDEKFGANAGEHCRRCSHWKKGCGEGLLD